MERGEVLMTYHADTPPVMWQRLGLSDGTEVDVEVVGMKEESMRADSW